jgi:hypothetical protein
MEVPLSDSDVAPYVRNVIVYSQLKDITARQLLKMLPVAILYQQSPTFGHWTILLRTPEGVTFFDPYGYMVDTEFKEIGWQQPHYLAKRLYELARLIPIHYNEYQLQSKKSGVNTCGRWICMRSLFDKWDTDTFAHAVKGAAKRLGITPDELVTRVIRPGTLE